MRSELGRKREDVYRTLPRRQSSRHVGCQQMLELDDERWIAGRVGRGKIGKQLESISLHVASELGGWQMKARPGAMGGVSEEPASPSPPEWRQWRRTQHRQILARPRAVLERPEVRRRDPHHQRIRGGNERSHAGDRSRPPSEPSKGCPDGYLALRRVVRASHWARI